MRSCVVLLWVVSAVLLASLSPCSGKRFDCKVFCKSTGFSGMVGGCRCSFTLFTSKRGALSARSSESEDQPLYLNTPSLEQQAMHVLIPYYFFRNMRSGGQKEVMEDTEFEGKNDLVFGNMYQ